ncbi:RIBOSOME BINDING PROTEIN-1, putative [Babesia bigemina]|uniref:RIBOSOME BINDING PROTEIN-1, putative n=1 Tax=Babesia bigemina TaxID=5866 RepID=A0A061D8T6_BABBI|nr:RIBOSOME BINDING PROTEIN-1, putative [Babesia bigemina]CDR96958.1 RIBOSOME BINDING PROTEIN-1, putative [Babesia bigemina]|eukprot:XP_012769144.1 RIBOSOME BINDING PROTEIN-1, putative [Babesia bigemina]
MVSAKKFYLTSLRECFIFFDWLNTQKKNIHAQIAQDLYKRINKYNKAVESNSIKASLSTFLSNVDKFYRILVSDGIPEKLLRTTNSINSDATTEEIVDALLECIPKFLAAMYYLWYDVNATFEELGGGGWKLNYPGALYGSYYSSSGGDLDNYLHAKNGSNYGGMIPGGFNPTEVRYGYWYSGYRQGYLMEDDIRIILDKKNDQCFRNVFLTTVGVAGKQKENVANVLALVGTFCDIVERDKGAVKSALEKQLKEMNGKCLDWSALQSHCKELKKSQIHRLFASQRFAHTGQSLESSDSTKEEIAKDAAKWLRVNLLEVKSHLNKIDTKDKVIDNPDKKHLGAYFTNNLFPYGFFFDDNHFRRMIKDRKTLMQNWRSVISKFVANGEGLEKLKTLLEGYNCPEDTYKKSEGAQNQGKKSEGAQNQGKKSEGAQNQGKKAEGAQNQGKKAEGAQNQGKKAEGAQNQGKKSEGAQNQGKKSEGAQNQGKKAEGAQNQGKKAEGAQNQGKKAEGAQNQGKKAEGAQNQGKKAEGAQNQGKKAEGAQNQGKKAEGAQNQGKKAEGAQNQGKKSEGAQNQGKKAEGTPNQQTAQNSRTTSSSLGPHSDSSTVSGADVAKGQPGAKGDQGAKGPPDTGTTKSSTPQRAGKPQHPPPQPPPAPPPSTPAAPSPAGPTSDGGGRPNDSGARSQKPVASKPPASPPSTSGTSPAPPSLAVPGSSGGTGSTSVPVKPGVKGQGSMVSVSPAQQPGASSQNVITQSPTAQSPGPRSSGVSAPDGGQNLGSSAGSAVPGPTGDQGKPQNSTAAITTPSTGSGAGSGGGGGDGGSNGKGTGNSQTQINCPQGQSLMSLWPNGSKFCVPTNDFNDHEKTYTVWDNVKKSHDKDIQKTVERNRQKQNSQLRYPPRRQTRPDNLNAVPPTHSNSLHPAQHQPIDPLRRDDGRGGTGAPHIPSIDVSVGGEAIQPTKSNHFAAKDFTKLPGLRGQAMRDLDYEQDQVYNELLFDEIAAQTKLQKNLEKEKLERSEEENIRAHKYQVEGIERQLEEHKKQVADVKLSYLIL